MNRSNRRTIVILLLLAMVWVMIPGYGYTAAEEGAEVEELPSVKGYDEIPAESEYREVPSAAEEALAKPDQQLHQRMVREVKEQRTSNSKHYLLEDGSYQAVISLGSLHYEDENGRWQNIDTTLVDEAEITEDLHFVSKDAANLILNERNHTDVSKRTDRSSYRVLYAPFHAQLPKHFNDGYSIQKEDSSVRLVPVGSRPSEGAVDSEFPNKVVYREVWDDTDVELVAEEYGIKENIILHSESAPSIFTFQIDQSIGSGKLQIAPSWLVDANGTYRDVPHVIFEEHGEQWIQLTADLSGLAFPVVIDPSVVTVGVSQQLCLYFDVYGNFCSGSLLQMYNGSYQMRSYIQFDLSSIHSNSVITSAVMSLAQYSSMTHNSTNVQVYGYQVTGPWTPSTLWGNQPSVASPAIFNVSLPLQVYYSVIRTFDITSTVQLWTSGTPNYGIRLTTNSSQYPMLFYGSNGVSGAPPSLTVNYNRIPGAPTVTSPNGGEIIDTTHQITWNAAIDPDNTQSTLKYHVQLSTNGGSTWSDIISLTAAGVTAYNYNFSSIPNTTNARVQVRAYDGTSYGPWDPSNAPFTIKHNAAPTAPTIVSPNGTSGSPTPALPTPTLQWTFNDPDAGDTQSQYRVIVYNGTTSVRDTAWVASGSSSYTVPSGVLSRGVTYNWKIATKDNKGAESPYSALRYFRTNVLPIATMTSYTNGQQVNDNVLTFTWTYSDTEAQPQTQFQVVGSKDNWATYAYDSGIVNSAATSHTTTPLSNGTWKFRVRVKDNLEWSAWANRDNLTLPNAFEPNDTSGTAFPILYANTYTSNISTASDVDWYRYTAAQTGIDRVTLTVPAGLNYDVTVYDASLNEVGFGMRGAGKTESVLYPVTGGHIYSIKLTGNGQFSTSAGYGLTAERLLLQFNTTYTFDNNGNLQSKSTVQQP